MNNEKQHIDAFDLESEIYDLSTAEGKTKVIRNKIISGIFGLNIQPYFGVSFLNCEFEELNLDSVEGLNLRLRDCRIERFNVFDLKSSRIFISVNENRRYNKIKSLQLENVEGDLRFSHSSIESVRISNFDSKRNLSIYSNQSTFSSLEISTILSRSNLILADDRIEKLIFSGSNRSEIKLEGTRNVKSIVFSHFNCLNEGSLTLNRINVVKPGFFEVDSTQFNRVFIKNSSFEELQLKSVDSNLSEVNIYNSQLPQIKDSNNPYRDKETCLQLKKTSIANSNFIDSKIYGAKELYFYWKYLKEDKQSFWERLPLAISKYTNNFGRSWLLAFWSLLGWTILLYLSLGVVQSSNWLDLKLFITSGRVFQFLFPIHNLDSILTNDSITSYWFVIYMISFFQRIFSGFYIYQLIRAFRFHYNT